MKKYAIKAFVIICLGYLLFYYFLIWSTHI